MLNIIKICSDTSCPTVEDFERWRGMSFEQLNAEPDIFVQQIDLPKDAVHLVQMVGATAEDLIELRDVFDQIKNDVDTCIFVNKEINIINIPWQSNVAPQ